MPLTPEEQAQGQRLGNGYNTAPWAEANNLGMGRVGAGGKGLFVAAIRDFVGYAKGVTRVMAEAVASVATVDGKVTAAAASAEAADESALSAAGSAGLAAADALRAALAADSVDGPAIAARIAALEDQGATFTARLHFGGL